MPAINLEVPIFGAEMSGKSYFLSGLTYWAIKDASAKLINKDVLVDKGTDRERYVNGADYITPRISAWIKNLYDFEKASHDGAVPITLEFPPGAISKGINRPVRLTTYVISSEDYAPTMRVEPKPTKKRGWFRKKKKLEPSLVKEQKPEPQPSPFEYIRPTDFFYQKMHSANAAICLLDIVRENDEPQITKTESGKGAWTLSVKETLYSQIHLLGCASQLPPNECQHHGVLAHGARNPIALTFSKADLLVPIDQRPCPMEELLNEAMLFTRGRLQNTRVFESAARPGYNDKPPINYGYQEILEYLAGHYA